MNRNRKGKMLEITREMYKSIKKYDRQQFTAFCTDLYGFGFQDGRESVPGIDITAIMKAIGNTKGIGAKKLADIKASIEAVFEGAGEDKKEGSGHDRAENEAD